MKESKLQSIITNSLRSDGRFVIKTQGGMAGTPIGTPDIITIGNSGILIGLELKRPDGKGSYDVTPEQYYQGAKITKFNGLWFKIDSVEKFLAIEELQ